MNHTERKFALRMNVGLRNMCNTLPSHTIINLIIQKPNNSGRKGGGFVLGVQLGREIQAIITHTDLACLLFIIPVNSCVLLFF